MQIDDKHILTADVQAPLGLSQWLNHELSLTDKLVNCTGNAELEVISQRWATTSYWDRNVLNIVEPQVFQREILMRSHGKEYWYARSLIPQSCYEANPEFFDRLKNESIRNLIFNNPEVVRSQLVTYPVNSHCLEYYWVKNHLPSVNGPLWVRFCRYLYAGIQPFFLFELLFPELENLSS